MIVCMKKNSTFLLWFDYIAITIIVIAFFVISYCGFFRSDDLMMKFGVSSFSDVLEYTRNWYFTAGGRLLTVAAQYLFSGVFGDNKLWFDIVNTIFFVVMIAAGGKLMGGKDKDIHKVLVFALLFWLLYPAPDESMFWVAGATTYLWGNALSLVFLAMFLKYKDDDFSGLGKIGVLILSVIAATEFITSASICGAFVVYYAFHIKSFKRNAIPFVAGFVIGSMVLLFAPGNFERAAWEETSFLGKLQDLMHHPFQEIVKYRALWLFLAVFGWGWIKNKAVIKVWSEQNLILLLSLGWSIVAFSLVFRPLNRALFFPEIISMVLFLRFLYDNYHIFGMRFFETLFGRNHSMMKSILVLVLFVVFLVDATFAIAETRKQRNINDVLLKEIADSGGLVALDQSIPSHRMAYAPDFPSWTWDYLANRYGFDSVRIYPYYCQDKFYKQAPPLDNVYIDEINYDNDNDVFGKYVRLIVRIENGDVQEQNNHIVFAIDYTRPKKWYKSWLDKLRNYQYDRTEFVERDNPDVCFNGYCYYVIWFGRENAKNLKSLNYELN